MTAIFVDGDACPVREEIYRVAVRLALDVFVASNGSRPIRPPGTPDVRMVLVGDIADAADDWIAEHISAVDVCVTSDILLASRCLNKDARVLAPIGKQWTTANIVKGFRMPARQRREGCTEAGVRKASREETAGGVRTDAGVGLWGICRRCLI